MQILLTGATGYTGGRLMRALLQRGDRVRALVRSPHQAAAVENAGAEACVGQITSEADFVRAAPLHRRRVGFFVNHREFDDSRARRELGYRPKVGFRDGVSRLARWYVDSGRLRAPTHPIAQT